MTNPTIEKAIAARDAAESVYRNLSVDVAPDIERAAYLQWEAAKALVSGLLQEERRKAGLGGSSERRHACAVQAS